MQVVGIIDLVWNGRKIEVEKGATFTHGGLMNEAVEVGRSTHRAQSYQSSEVKGTTVLKRGQRWRDIWTTEEGELQVACDSGQTFIIKDAFLEGDIPEIKGGEGKFDLTWKGGIPEEILG